MPVKRTSLHLLRWFVAGTLAALPLAATVAVFWWAAQLLLRWLGPDSLLGSLLVLVGLGVSGSEVVGYLVGLAVVVVLVTLLGALVSAGMQRGLSQLFDRLVRHIPVVRTVYELATKLVGLLSQREQDGPKRMRAVWVHFGGPGGASVLALLSSPQPVLVDGRRCLAVLVPTAPVPVGGGLLFVPEAWVSPAEVGVEALTSIYVSMGVTAPQHLPVASTATDLPVVAPAADLPPAATAAELPTAPTAPAART
jgi:uncharacterized membrane protein